jgi:SAD/SRA domain
MLMKLLLRGRWRAGERCSRLPMQATRQPTTHDKRRLGWRAKSMLDIISHSEMCHREGRNLQQGMNYQIHGTHSVILMSLRQNAPYEDEVSDDGSTIVYEGHDTPRHGEINPKTIDQPLARFSGEATENGKFYAAARAFATESSRPRRVRVYEKIKPNIWSYNGVFHLVDAWVKDTGSRKVLKFKLVAVEGEENFDEPSDATAPHRRLIPSWVKLAVFKRDAGQCVICTSKEDLHYDHDLPFSRGGSSLTPENIRLLCGRHNLQKSARIEWRPLLQRATWAEMLHSGEFNVLTYCSGIVQRINALLSCVFQGIGTT